MRLEVSATKNCQREKQIGRLRVFAFVLRNGRRPEDSATPDTTLYLFRRRIDTILPAYGDILRCRFPEKALVTRHSRQMDAAFVEAVWRYSQVMGSDVFPHGIYVWPPPNTWKPKIAVAQAAPVAAAMSVAKHFALLGLMGEAGVGGSSASSSKPAAAVASKIIHKHKAVTTSKPLSIVAKAAMAIPKGVPAKAPGDAPKAIPKGVPAKKAIPKGTPEKAATVAKKAIPTVPKGASKAKARVVDDEMPLMNLASKWANAP
jgi:hypothetical protein